MQILQKNGVVKFRVKFLSNFCQTSSIMEDLHTYRALVEKKGRPTLEKLCAYPLQLHNFVQGAPTTQDLKAFVLNYFPTIRDEVGLVQSHILLAEPAQSCDSGLNTQVRQMCGNMLGQVCGHVDQTMAHFVVHHTTKFVVVEKALRRDGDYETHAEHVDPICAELDLGHHKALRDAVMDMSEILARACDTITKNRGHIWDVRTNLGASMMM